MYKPEKEQIYQNTANMLSAASSFREITLPLSEVAIQFAELLNEVKKNKPKNGATEEAATEEKSTNKGGRKPKATA
jgi:hypothetical protein